MRHQANCTSRWLSRAILASCVLFAASPYAKATPVYLRLESRFPSGHYSRSWLESRTKTVQFQRWHRVQTKDGAFGWLPEDHLITPLKLATSANLTEDVPARLDPQMDSILGRPMLPKGTQVTLLEIKGSWARALPLKSLNQEVWIPTESLKADTQQRISKAFVHSPAAVYVMPGVFARKAHQLKPGRFVQVMNATPGWLEIKTSTITGFVRTDDAWTLTQLGEKGVRPLSSLTALRSAPLPFADLIRSLPLSTSLQILESKTLRWGQIKITDLGDVWWPINDDFDDDKETAVNSSTSVKEKLSTASLFSRKIFDMASSPAIPSLKFVSAQGVFRTLDGQEWNKIPLFKNQNYPIAIATSGAVFVGPYISEDHGETFQQWIRWDTLVATLRNQRGLPASGLQILEIKPSDSSGRRVQLNLNVGQPESVKVITDDQGSSWRAL